MTLNLYDATDVIPSGFDGTAFEPILKALADICGAPFDTQTPNATIYRMAAVYALAHGMDDMLIGDSDILNALAAALRIPAWRPLVRAETEEKRRLAARTLRVWLNYRGCTGGAVPNSAAIYDDGTSYKKPDADSFIDLLLAGGATAVAAVKTWDGKDEFHIFADRPDDLLFWVNGYDPAVFDAGFNAYLGELYKRFAGISARAHISIVASQAVENTEIYSIGSNIQYDAIHDYIARAYSIDGGLTWIQSADLYDNGLTANAPNFGPCHDENVGAGDPWSFGLGVQTYFLDSSENYPFDAPYTRTEISDLTNSSGITVHGYDGTYTANVTTNYTDGLSQPEITPDTETLPSFDAMLSASFRAYFIESELSDITVYTNDASRTPTPAWSYTKGGRTWYFVRDRIGYDKSWVYKEDGLNGEGYRSDPFPYPVTIGITTSIPAGCTRITSGFWWMYNFNGGGSLSNLWTPVHYASQTLLATSNQEQPGGAEYAIAYFWNGSYMEDFSQLAITLRLQMYNGLPEMYTSSGESVTGSQCGIVVQPGYAPTWTSDNVWDLPSDLYTISGTTITWNTSHPLYNLLIGQAGSARND